MFRHSQNNSQNTHNTSGTSGGTNSTNTTNTTNTTNSTNLTNSSHKADEYYLAKYTFEARSEIEISVKRGERVTMLAPRDADGNSEWWFMMNEANEQGYMPANYLQLTNNQ